MDFLEFPGTPERRNPMEDRPFGDYLAAEDIDDEEN